ncbi:uncharacterized protein LOC100899967 [Galendromus occidentalis]|uniref:Uncharacterized protein LOC100899967 n=1 Tax=Galendromus occidentalis TaxID=34638 RepID=A0AAJ7L5F1_9ACAR|nr:uncharacterized protein LOC100899967 [Galendromus occidentalis]
MPERVQKQRQGCLYFIKGLEPYHSVIVHKNARDAVAAQTCANSLNEDWTHKRAHLKGVEYPPDDLDYARMTRIFVASLSIDGNCDVRTYVQRSLPDFIIIPVENVSVNNLARLSLGEDHPTPIIVPYLSQEEICEVVSLRKHPDRPRVFEIGLKLQGYLDLELIFGRMVGRRAHFPQLFHIKPLKAITLSNHGFFKQRGLTLETGQVLGIDSLDVIDSRRFEVRPLPPCLAQAFPYTALYIDWDTTVRSRAPSLGDTVVVTNLKLDVSAINPLHHSYDEIIRKDHATHIEYRPRYAEKKPAQQPSSKTHSKSKKSPTSAEWYGLSQELEAVLMKAPSFVDRFCKLEILLAEFGETIRIEEI